MPPSTRKVLAVMKLDSSEARKSTALAISSGSPKRPIGTCTSRRAARSTSLANSSLSSGVFTGPGHSAFTRIALAGELHPELATHREHAALGGRVGDLAGRSTHHRDERGSVDDRPRPLLEHVAQRSLAAQVDARQVHVLHPAPDLEVGVHDRGVLGRRDARVVEGDVHGAVGVLGRLEQRVHLFLVGYVDAHVLHQLLTAELADELVTALVVDVADDDLGPLLDEAVDRGQPDARAPAGDDGHLAVQPSCHLTFPFGRPRGFETLASLARQPPEGAASGR